MTASTIDRNTKAPYLQRQGFASLANPCVVPAGVMVAVNAAGLVPTGGSSDAAGLVVVGRSEHSADYSAGDRTMTYSRGVYSYAMTAALLAAVQANIGRIVYLEDNVTVGLASDTTSMIPAGVLESVEGGMANVAVGLFNIAQLGATPVANASVSPAASEATNLLALPFLFPDAATADYDFIVPFKCEIVDAHGIKDAAGAANTLQLKNGAGTAISDAMAFAVDKTITRAATLDKATRVLAAGAVLRFTNTRAAGSSAGAAFVYVIPRA